MIHLLCFGFGYSACVLAKQLVEKEKNIRVTGTMRPGSLHPRFQMQDKIEIVTFDRYHSLDVATLKNVTHILISIPPWDGTSDLVADLYGTFMQEVTWVGYLSTTGVYGDTGGSWVDETTPVQPQTKRSVARSIAEKTWQSLQAPVHLFRLSGIYGQGRSAIDLLRKQSAHRLVKPGHISCRVHVLDLALILEASMRRPDPGAIYNICDDEPASPQDVIAYAATLLKVEPPPLLDFAQAQYMLSPLALSFYTESRRICNARVKRELSVQLCYPTYREGLVSCLHYDKG